ncbi:MAG: histidine kinase [Gemmatimonadetes bacterium]|nr:MAG: histidine kinase [Gemmatimonadota bacterium]
MSRRSAPPVPIHLLGDISPGRTDTERLLEEVIAVAADAVVSTDDAQRIIIFNPAAERIFGYRRDEVLGHPFACLLPRSAQGAHDADLEALSGAAEDRREPSGCGRIWGRRKSGELFPAEASISRLTVGEATYFTAVLRDVSRERRAEKEHAALLARTHATRTAAEEAERRMAFLANVGETLHSSLAVETTFDALLELIVPELADCCLVEVLEAQGRAPRAHVAHRDHAMQALVERLGAYPRQQTRYLARRGVDATEAALVGSVSDDFLRSFAEDDEHLALLRRLGFSSLIILPLSAHGRVLGALLLARGPGDRPYTEADLALAQALAQRAASALDNARLYDEARRAVQARDQLLGIVSHDLRTPLSVVAMCAAALLGEGFADEARDRETLETIQRSTRWAQRLIQDLLDVSAIDAGGLSLTRRPEDPRMLVTRAILLYGELAAERRIELVAELDSPLSTIDVDADRIVQALGNLIGNAVKFTPYGGSVRIGAVDEEGRVRLYVSDTGPGIPEDQAAHVFERFWTEPREARVRGTGMGLAIVRGIVGAHGGRAWLEPPQPGAGATFCIALAALPARAV